MREPATLSRRALAAAIPLAALAAAPAATVPTLATAGDAALLDLGRRWEVAVAALHAHDLFCGTLAADDIAAHHAQDVIGDRLYADEQRHFDSILETPARTLEGLALKAKVLARANDILEPGLAPLEAALAKERTDFETHAALSLALDILKLARCSS